MRQYEDEIYGPNAILRNRDYYELRSKNSILNLDYFILYCDNYIVGYIGTWASVRNTAHIAEIWIVSHFRGQGLTKILLEKAILTLMASGLDRIIFQTGHPAVMKTCQQLGAYLVGPWTKICYK
jgi:ribosomal protein S18 acetylase RimI-like enzyme